MMADIRTVMWKEWKEFLSSVSGRSRFIVLIFVVILGIIAPLQSGLGWIQSPGMLFLWAWVPLWLVVSVIADSFAGERERHTLEALLATRLSDRTILLGKVGASVAYGLGITWLSVLLGLVTVNIAHGHGTLLLYSAPLGLGIAVVSVLGAFLAAGAGVLISLRARTARQATQTLMLGVMVVFFGVVFGLQALPAAWKASLTAALATGNVIRIAVIAGLILLAIDVALLLGAMARFRRDRLILD